MDILQLEEKLLSLPIEIKQRQWDTLDKTQIAEEKRKQSKKIEIDIAAKIGADTSIKNDTQRKATIQLALDSNSDYQKNQGEIVFLESQSKLLQIELEYLHNLFSAYKAVANMVR